MNDGSFFGETLKHLPRSERHLETLVTWPFQVTRKTNGWTNGWTLPVWTLPVSWGPNQVIALGYIFSPVGETLLKSMDVRPFGRRKKRSMKK